MGYEFEEKLFRLFHPEDASKWIEVLETALDDVDAENLTSAEDLSCQWETARVDIVRVRQERRTLTTRGHILQAQVDGRSVVRPNQHELRRQMEDWHDEERDMDQRTAWIYIAFLVVMRSIYLFLRGSSEASALKFQIDIAECVGAPENTV